MDLFREISENKFCLLLLTEDQYENKLTQVVKDVSKIHKKICYACLSKPYKDVIENLKNMDLDLAKFFFIDVYSSHYEKQGAVDNCIFLKEPGNLVAIEVAIDKAITQKNCSAVIFDTISSLLMYEQTHDIIRFTHNLTIEERHKDLNKVFIILKGDPIVTKYNDSLIDDVQMFTDKSIELDQVQS